MFTIRTATKRDIAGVDAMMARSYPQLLARNYAPSMLVMALPRISRAQPALITSGTYYVVAGAGGGIVGAGGWTIAAPGNGAVRRGVAHVRHVATDATVTRQGIGRMLMDQDRKSTRLNSSHFTQSRMPSSA